MVYKMPQVWLEGVKRRSVEKDFRFYDPPGRIWEILNRRTWDYSRSPELMRLRDLALMAILYWTSSRISEIVRTRIYQKRDGFVEPQYIGSLPSIKASQFVEVEKDFLNLRDIRILKRQVEDVSDYPVRNEIRFPLTGDLAVFTDPIVEYLERLKPNDELFCFKAKRGFQIVNHCTALGEEQGYMPHYLREMGLKFRFRLYNKNIKVVQDYSGHSSLENLLRYLAEMEDTEAILNYKMYEDNN